MSNTSKTIKEQLADIPGTYPFTQERCRLGYHLNMFFTTLLKEENRRAFLEDESKYLEKFHLTKEQRHAILARDWAGMLKVGANIYHMSKLGGTDRKTFQYLAGQMAGMSEQDYRDMMLKGGRPLKGNRSKSEALEPS
ncbi:MAG: protocatechuate 4,5-dioxygenase subunit alpha [Opitutaceae bacterium]|nr:protocatechuate 4,5-dioxygenase subunit alpha [Opitutaceae bacterium]